MRYYGKWDSRPEGTPEDSNCCMVEVYSLAKYHSNQCTHKRGWGKDGLFCKFHAGAIERGVSVDVPINEVLEK